jgi:hypothetical protein
MAKQKQSEGLGSARPDSVEGLGSARPDSVEETIPSQKYVAALKAEKAKAELAQMAEESLARGAKKVTTPEPVFRSTEKS